MAFIPYLLYAISVVAHFKLLLVKPASFYCDSIVEFVLLVCSFFAALYNL
jgi:hypothetical protein